MPRLNGEIEAKRREVLVGLRRQLRDLKTRSNVKVKDIWEATGLSTATVSKMTLDKEWNETRDAGFNPELTSLIKLVLACGGDISINVSNPVVEPQLEAPRVDIPDVL